MVSLPNSEERSPSLMIIDSGFLMEPHSLWKAWILDLQRQGWQVQVVTQADLCMDVIRNNPPDLILLIDGLDGADSWAHTFCVTLCSDGAIAHIPVVIFGKDSASNTILNGLRAGAADYLSPITSNEEAIARLSYHAVRSQQFSRLRHRKQELLEEVEKAREIQDSLRVQAAQEKLFAELTQRIRQSLDLTTILDAAVWEVRQLLQADRVLVYRFNPDWSGKIVIESVSSEDLSILGTVIHDPCFENHWNQRYLKGYVGVIDDIRALRLNPCYLNLLESLNIRANLVLPILQQDRLWGLLIAHHCVDKRVWQDWEVELLQKLSAQLAIAIQQSELYCQLQLANQELERLANLDSLTQLANRRQFDQYMTQEWRRLQREQMPISLLLCDIDYFKQYNDAYGHQAGDDCLKQVALAIASVAKRPADLVARYGGEEFSVILPNTDLEGAVEVAVNIQSAIAQRFTPTRSPSESTVVTLSIGIACIVPTTNSTSAQLIAAADQGLYAAKAKGRNCYCVWKIA